MTYSPLALVGAPCLWSHVILYFFSCIDIDIRQTCLNNDLEEVCELLSGTKEIPRRVRGRRWWMADGRYFSISAWWAKVPFLIKTPSHDKCQMEGKGVLLNLGKVQCGPVCTSFRVLTVQQLTWVFECHHCSSSPTCQTTTVRVQERSRCGRNDHRVQPTITQIGARCHLLWLSPRRLLCLRLLLLAACLGSDDGVCSLSRGGPGTPLSRHFHQLKGNSKAFPGPLGNLIAPVCHGTVLESSPEWTWLKHHRHREPPQMTF